ncbi:MAG: hypothetical protein AB8G11_14500 [Saprospiraceae bacterium]
MPYIIHAAILLSGCYLLYQFLLKTETFYKLNRWLLVACIFVAFALPMFEVPANYSLRQAEKIENKKSEQQKTIVLDDKIQAIEKVSTDEQLQETNQEIPIIAAESTKKTTITNTFKPINWQRGLRYIYMIGLGIFAINFLIQLSSLLWTIIKNPTIKDGKFRIIEMSEDKAPYSFLNNIFINPTKYDWETYNQILEHEKIHIEERHTLDILFAELIVIFQWFNPFAWRIRQAIERNLEFLTDSRMLQKGTDKATYQLNLLKISAPDYPLNITTNYNQSFLKTRIMMMEAKKSSMRSAWKYLLLLPLLGLSIITLNAVQPDFELVTTTEAEQTEEEHDYEIPTKGDFEAKMNGNLVCVKFKSDVGEEEENITWTHKKCFPKTAFSDLTAQTFSITRATGELKFTGKFDGKKGSGSFEFIPNETFKKELKDFDDNEITASTLFLFFLNNTDAEYIAYVKSQNYADFDLEKLEGFSLFGVSLSELKEMNSALKSMGYDDVKMEEIQALTIHNVQPDYIKTINKDIGKTLKIEEVVQAHIHKVSPEYIKKLEAVGLENMDFELISQFAIHNIEVDYIKMLQNSDLGDLEEDEIVAAAIHNVNPEMIKKYQALNLKGFDFDDLIGFAIHNIDVDYIKSLQNAGLGDLDIDDIIAAAIHQVQPETIKKYQNAGLKDMNFEDVVGFAMHNIDVDYIKRLKNSGLDLDNDDLIGAAIHKVEPETIKKYQALNLENLDFEDILGFAIHNVDVEYIKSLQNAGLGNLEAEEVVAAAIHKVDPAFIKKYLNSGLDNLEFDDIINYAIHNVTLEYIESLRKTGVELDTEDIANAAIHNVDAAFIKKYQDANLEGIDLENIINFSIHNIDVNYVKSLQNSGLSQVNNDDIAGAKIHGVDAAFIKSIIDLGFNNPTLDDIVQLKIHNIDADYIEQKRAEGFDNEELEDYVDLKIGQ